MHYFTEVHVRYCISQSDAMAVCLAVNFCVATIQKHQLKIYFYSFGKPTHFSNSLVTNYIKMMQLSLGVYVKPLGRHYCGN